MVTIVYKYAVLFKILHYKIIYLLRVNTYKYSLSSNFDIHASN